MSESATAEKTVTQIERKAFVALCQRLKLVAVSGDWPQARLVKKLEKFPTLFADIAKATEEFKLKDTEVAYLNELCEAVKSGSDIEFDAKKAKEATPKEKKEKKESTVERDAFGCKVGSQASKNAAALTKEPQTMKELVTKSGAPDTFYNQMNDLVAKGLVLKSEKGYCLP